MDPQEMSADAVDPGTDGSPADEARRKALRENARRVLRASGVPELLISLNRSALKGRGTFEEYDTGVIFRWGSGFTRRHIWVDVSGDSVRFRLREHLRCRAPIPACDGEYHSFTPEMWGDRSVIEREIQRGYEHPVAESSED